MDSFGLGLMFVCVFFIGFGVAVGIFQHFDFKLEGVE